MTTKTYDLPDESINIIIDALADRPYRQVHQVISDLISQHGKAAASQQAENNVPLPTIDAPCEST